MGSSGNGLIWAELLGRDVDIILDPDIDSPNINFAISGAHMTRGGDLVPFGVETGVRVQTEEFAALVESDALSIGNNDVAFMIAGANDFLDRLEIDDPADEIVADVAAAAAENIAALANSGVKTIILSEIQPLRFAPQFSGDPETQDALAQLIEAANAEMFGRERRHDAVRSIHDVRHVECGRTRFHRYDLALFRLERRLFVFDGFQRAEQISLV